MFESGVGDGGAIDVEVLEVLETFEVSESGVGDLGFFEVESFESSESGDRGQSGVGDLGSSQVERVDVCDILEWCELFVADFSIREVEGDIESSVVLCDFEHRASGLLDRRDGSFFCVAEYDLGRSLFGLGFSGCFVLGPGSGAGQQSQCQECDQASHAVLLLRSSRMCFAESTYHQRLLRRAGLYQHGGRYGKQQRCLGGLGK